MKVTQEIVITLNHNEAKILQKIIDEYEFDDSNLSQIYDGVDLESVENLCRLL